MKKELRVTDYLEHILASIEKIQNYVRAMDWEAFSASGLTQDAVIRNLEIIGEAARNILRVDPGFLDRHPEIPLANAIGMRNTLAHGYLDVRLDIVWAAVQQDLPRFAVQLGELGVQLSGEEKP